jgi:hypothetical protein
MSRITLHLKKQFYSPSPTRHRYEEEAHELSFSRDRTNSDTVTRTRSRSYSSFVGRASLDTPVRLPPVHILSTIPSALNSGAQTPANGSSPVQFSTDMGEMVSARLREQGQQRFTQTWTAGKGGQKSL